MTIEDEQRDPASEEVPADGDPTVDAVDEEPWDDDEWDDDEWDEYEEELDEDAWDVEDRTADTIVNRQARIGRNEPCPCGSGKKFKKCCGRR